MKIDENSWFNGSSYLVVSSLSPPKKKQKNPFQRCKKIIARSNVPQHRGTASHPQKAKWTYMRWPISWTKTSSTHTAEIWDGTQTWRFRRCFSFSNGWFLRFHVCFPGCKKCLKAVPVLPCDFEDSGVLNSSSFSRKIHHPCLQSCNFWTSPLTAFHKQLCTTKNFAHDELLFGCNENSIVVISYHGLWTNNIPFSNVLDI